MEECAMYLAPKIDKALERVKPAMLGAIHKNELIDTLTSTLRNFGTTISSDNLNIVKQRQYSVAGAFDMHTKHKPIEICISLNKHQKTLKIESERQWSIFKFNIAMTLQHELVHKSQWQHRDASSSTVTYDFRALTEKARTQLYLSHIDEIDAYAHDIALQIKYFYPNKDPYAVLSNISRYTKLEDYNYYANTFRNYDWYHIKKLLLKRVYGWIPHTIAFR